MIILFGTVFITLAFGLWKTTSSKIPAIIQSGENQGEYNPADIKGSYTFSEISQVFQIPIEDITAAFSITSQDADTFKCKDLESIYSSDDGREIGTDSVRLFVALYKGLPYGLNDTTYLPESAQEILLSVGNMTEEQKQFVETHKK